MTRYKKGKIVKGNITGIEKYGIFVSLDDYYSGLIHISEISNNYVKDVNDFAKIGETVYVKVIDVDEKESHVKLSIKDIDYRKSKKSKNNQGIKEVGSGFAILSQKRDEWIEQKMRELS